MVATFTDQPEPERPSGEAESINVLMARVSKKITSIAKGHSTGEKVEDRGPKYAFRGIDDVFNAIHPLLAKEGIITYPMVLRLERTERETVWEGKKRYQTVALVTLEIRFVGPNGDEQTADAAGEAHDYGDKAVSKASSIAFRTAMIQTFTIPVSNAITPEQVTKIAIGLKEKIHPSDRTIWHSYISAVVGREITSNKDLTVGEASDVIDALETEESLEVVEK